MSVKTYIIGGSDGWLNVKREPSGAVIALPEFLQVSLTSSNNGRDYFTVLEGCEISKSFSVKSGNLKTGLVAYSGPASLLFNIAKKTLTYPGGVIKAITDVTNPIPKGSYPIQIPDFPHNGGIGYLSQSSYAKTWFYLANGNAIPGNNDRYLHPGTGTLGCITVAAGGWTNLYKYLIKCRSGNAKNIGNVNVV